MKGQSEYMFLASASRSTNMDRYIKDFLKRKPDGVIVQASCQAEVVHEIIMVFSFVPLVFSIWAGDVAVF